MFAHCCSLLSSKAMSATEDDHVLRKSTIGHMILNSQQLSLDTIDRAASIKQRRSQSARSDLADFDRLCDKIDGICVSVLSTVMRIPEDKRTSAQRALLRRYAHADILKRSERFRRVLSELVEQSKNDCTLLDEVRQVVLEVVPEATHSPRATLSSLSASPRRPIATSPHRTSAQSKSTGDLIGCYKK